MIKVLEFYPQLASVLPETYALLRSSNLTVHPRVRSIVLHGSRGLANRYRLDSDIDLSLVVDRAVQADSANLELLKDIYETTLRNWSSNIELDLAVVFDINKCPLSCFEQNMWDPEVCASSGVDCFGLYKTGKGFDGLVTHARVEVKRMYPCLTIWQRG
jgi:hypothetical protein